MGDCLEVLFVGDHSGNQKTVNCFNPNVGTTLMTYKGSGASYNCISIIGNDFLIAADINKPILNVWFLNSQEPSQELKMVVSGKPSALCVSPNGHFCVAAINSKIYTWQVSSGALLKVLNRHYQEVNKILFTDDSSHFVSVGEDGLAFVWKLADVIAKQFVGFYRPDNFEVPPMFSLSHHSLPITDAFLGCGNLKSRLFTVSLDQTCKVYNLSDGELLLSIVFEYNLTAVSVNQLETELFVGTKSGKIQIFHLEPYPRSLEYHVPEDINTTGTLNGHSKKISCLSNSLDGITLASGSDDGKVFLWNIPSRQLIRSFDMKGPITNLFFHLTPGNLLSEKFKPQLVVSKFNKTCNADGENAEAIVWVHNDIKPISLIDEFEGFTKINTAEKTQKAEATQDEISSMRNQILELKDINKQLYQFAMNKIIKNSLTIGMNNTDDVDMNI